MKSNELYFIFINENWICLEWIISFQRRKIKWTARFESTFWFIRTIKWIQLDSSHCARFVCAERQRRFRYIQHPFVDVCVYASAIFSFFLHDCLCTLGDRCVKQAKTFYWDTKQTYKRKCSITFMRDLNRHDWMDDFVQAQTIAKQTQRDLFKRPLFYLLLFSQIAHMDYKFILCIQHL